MPSLYSMNVGTLSSSARATMWSCVGPTNTPPDSITAPPGSRWLSTRPPTRLRASTTSTELPPRATWRAATRPEIPAPTTTTSTLAGRSPCRVAASAAPSSDSCGEDADPGCGSAAHERASGDLGHRVSAPRWTAVDPLARPTTSGGPMRNGPVRGTSAFPTSRPWADSLECTPRRCTSFRRISGTADSLLRPTRSR